MTPTHLTKNSFWTCTILSRNRQEKRQSPSRYQSHRYRGRRCLSPFFSLYSSCLIFCVRHKSTYYLFCLMIFTRMRIVNFRSIITSSFLPGGNEQPFASEGRGRDSNPGARLHRPVGYQATSPRPHFNIVFPDPDHFLWMGLFSFSE